jgi:uncharacterized MnhB-related membrane protein
MEYLTSIFILLIIIAPFAIFARQIRRVRIRTQSWLKAAIWFVLFAICPVCLYALLIAALVAVGTHQIGDRDRRNCQILYFSDGDWS